VINAGGLINVYNEMVGYNREVAMRMARGIFANMARLFAISRTQSIPTYLAADHLAEERIARVKGLGGQHWVRTIRRRAVES
jgi:leucine dehydrogenase